MSFDSSFLPQCSACGRVLRGEFVRSGPLTLHERCAAGNARPPREKREAEKLADRILARLGRR